MVGVIVPVHGFAPFLAETLDGLLAQDPRPEEIVVVDDGSPEPVVLLDEHAAHCRLVRHPENRGLAAARETGLGELDTELIALCDADDTWTAGKLAAQLQALAPEPDAVACFGSARIVGFDGRERAERWDELPAGRHEAGDLLPLLYERNPLCVSSALLRRDAVVAAGGMRFAQPRAEDWDLWLRLLARGGAFVIAPTAVVRYRRGPGALTSDVAAMADAQLYLHAEHAGLVREDVRRRVEAADRTALARGLIRRRRWGDARAQLRRAAALARPGPRERALRMVAAVPGARGVLGRRDPYG